MEVSWTISKIQIIIAKLYKYIFITHAACILGLHGISHHICLIWTSILMPPSQKKYNYRFRLSQTFLSLTKFIETIINIYDSKYVTYKNILHD